MNKQIRESNQGRGKYWDEDRGKYWDEDRGKPSPYYIRAWEDDSSYIVGAYPWGSSTQPPSPIRVWRPAVPFIIFFLFVILLFLFPLPASALTVTNTGRIYGQLLDGSKRDAPVARQSVTLQMAQGENARDLTTVTTNAQGMFSFTDLNTDKTINYALYTLYQGAQYYTDLIDLSTKPAQLINLKVYDATTSISNLAVVQSNMLIDNAASQSKLVTISETYVFENLGLTTYVGSLQANGSKPNALRFSLPKNARNVSLKSGFDGYQVIQVDAGFATNAAVSPGLTQFSFSFQVPYTTSSYDFAYTVVYPTVNLSLLVPVNIHASSAALNSQGPVNTNQQTFQQFNATKLLPGAQIHVQLDGLPLSQQSANSQLLNQNTRWIIFAILLMLVIVGATWLVYQLTRRRARKLQKQTSLTSRRGSSGLSSKAKINKSLEHALSPDEALLQHEDQQESLLQELLNLDKSYEAGTIKKSEYDERRASTKAKLRTLLSEDMIEQSSSAKKTARSSGKGAK